MGKIFEDARKSVEPYCKFCANNRGGRCAIIANGTSDRTDLLYRRGFRCEDPIISPDQSCAGKLNSCGIDSSTLPFVPRPSIVITQIVVNLLRP